jgi:hypothetical protein
MAHTQPPLPLEIAETGDGSVVEGFPFAKHGGRMAESLDENKMGTKEDFVRICHIYEAGRLGRFRTPLTMETFRSTCVGCKWLSLHP